jgi:hypothetical protein
MRRRDFLVAGAILTLRPSGLIPHWTKRCRQEARCNSPPLLDNLVGSCEQRWRHDEVERLGSFKVDHE